MPQLSSVFKEIIEHLPHVVLIINKQQKIIFGNKLAHRYWPEIANNKTTLVSLCLESFSSGEQKLIDSMWIAGQKVSYLTVKQINAVDLALFRSELMPLESAIDSDALMLAVLQPLQFFYKTKDLPEQSHLLKVLDSAENAFILFHLDVNNQTKILYANKSAAKLYGYRLADWHNMSIFDLWDKNSPDIVQFRVQFKLLKSSEKWKHQTIHLNKKAVDFPVEMNLSKIGSVGMELFSLECRSLEKEKITLSQLSVLRSIFDYSPDILFKLDKDFFVIDANLLACDRFLMPHSRIVGAPLREVTQQKGFDIIMPFLTTALSGEKIEAEINFCFRQKNNARILLQVFPQTSRFSVNSLVVVMKDITEAQNLLDSISESERKYRTLFENSTFGIVLHRIDGSIVSVNKEICRMLEYPENELLRMNIMQFHLLDDQHFIKEKILFLNFEESFTAEVKLSRSSGNIVYASVHARYVIVNNEKLVLTTIQDISMAVITRLAFEDQNRFLELIINNIPMQLFWKSVDLKLLGANKAFLKAFGYNHVGDILGKSDEDFDVDEETRAIFLSSDQKVLETRQALMNIEIKFTDKEGKACISSTNKFPIFDENKQLIGILGIAMDITERHFMLAQLIDREKKYRLLAENSVDVIWALDNQFKFVFSSKSSEKLFGYTLEERAQLNIQIENLYTKNSLDLIRSAFINRADEYSRDPGSNRRIELELEAIHKDGHHFWVGVSAGFYFNSNGKVDGIQGITRDITEEKNAKLELLKAKEKAEESDKLKSAFLASVSHELRTPLNAIIGFSSLCSPQKSVEKLVEYGKTVNRSAIHLQKIIESIFNLALLQSNELPIVISEFSVRELILELKMYAQSEMSILNKSLDIYLDFKVPANLNMRSDKSKLLQLLTNLVNNAIKYTHKGSVTIGFTVQEMDIVFFVCDTGDGIPKDKFEYIFGRFTQIEKQSYSSIGVGLGLAIAKEIAELLSGKIWLHSEVNKGSEFYFQTPLSLTN